MKIQELIKTKGIQKIFEECNYDLRDVREYIKRECNLTKNVDLSRTMRDFKVYLKNHLNKRDKSKIDEIISKLK